MSHLDPGPLARYNSLQDKHLAGYFGNTKMKKHLIKSGLVKKSGEIVDDNSYRLKMAKKEHQKHVRDLLATAIVHKALDIERMRQFESRKKLDELYKVDLVKRVKNEKSRKGDEDVVPLLLPRSARRSRSHPGSAESSRKLSDGSSNITDSSASEGLPEIAYDTERRRLFAKSAPPHGRREMMAGKDAIPYKRSHTFPHPPPKKKSARRKIQRSLILARTDTAVAHRIQLQSLAEVSLKFAGPNLHLTNDMFSSHKLHEIMVLQQHCGGSTLCVFRELLPPNTNFTFISRRHRGAPFGLTVYIDGVQDIRVSSCCEYKHKPGCKLGGKNAKFLFLGVTGAAPCYKCQVAFTVAEEMRAAKAKSKKESQRKSTEEENTLAENDEVGDPPVTVEITFRNADSRESSEKQKQEDGDNSVMPKDETEAGGGNDMANPENFESSTKIDSFTQTEEQLSAFSEEEVVAEKVDKGDLNEYEDDEFEDENENEEEDKQGESSHEDAPKSSESSSSSSSESEDEDSSGDVVKHKKERKEAKDGKNASEEEEIKSESEKESSASDVEDETQMKSSNEEGDGKGDREDEQEVFEESGVAEDSSAPANEDEGGKDQDGMGTEIVYKRDEDSDGPVTDDSAPRPDVEAHADSTEDGGAISSEIVKDSDAASVEKDDGKEEEAASENADRTSETTEVEPRQADAGEEEKDSASEHNQQEEVEGAKGIGEDISLEQPVPGEAEEKLNVNGNTVDGQEGQDDMAASDKSSESDQEKGETLKGDSEEEGKDKSVDVEDGKAVETDIADVIEDAPKENESAEGREDGVTLGHSRKDTLPEVETGDLESNAESGEKNVEQSEEQDAESEGNTEEKVEETKENVEGTGEKVEETGENVEGNGEKVKEGEETVEESEESVDGAEESVEEAERKYEGTEGSLERPEDKVEETEDKVEGTDDKVEGTEDKVEGTEDKVEGTEDKVEEIEDKVEGTEDKVEGTEGKVEGTEEESSKNEDIVEDDNELVKNENESVVFDPDEELSRAENEDQERESLDAGNDPDGVAEGIPADNGAAFDRQPSLKHDGPVAPLIDSTSDLELNSVALTPDQLEEVSEMVSANPVDSLSLRNAAMDDGNIEKIKDAVKNAGSLKMLNLNLNSIGPVGAGHLADVIKKNKNLKMLMLHGNDLGDEGIGHIVDALLEDESITTLDIGDCKIGDDGAVRVAELLEKNHTIKDMNLSGNQITKRGWEAISDGLKRNKSLTTLSLDFNDLRDEGTEIVCEGIRDNSSLKSIDFEGNKIGDFGARRILAAVKNNTQILDVTLMPSNDISVGMLDEIKGILKAREI